MFFLRTFAASMRSTLLFARIVSSNKFVNVYERVARVTSSN